MKKNSSATRHPLIPPRSRYTGYGWIPDYPDRRDWLYSSVPRPSRKMPVLTDLRSGCSPVEDQGEIGSCTANALAGALEFLQKKDGVPFEDKSRLFIYYNERVIAHSTGADSGAQLRDGIKTLAKQGACRESIWPYLAGKLAVKPPDACYRDALEHRISRYRRIITVREMKTCLAEGFPFVFGFMVFGSFESNRVARSGIVDMPGRRETPLGGHAVLAVGYDERESRFIARNSWGTGWGMRGYFTIPYEYLESRELAADFWTIRREAGKQARKGG